MTPPLNLGAILFAFLSLLTVASAQRGEAPTYTTGEGPVVYGVFDHYYWDTAIPGSGDYTHPNYWAVVPTGVTPNLGVGIVKVISGAFISKDPQTTLDEHERLLRPFLAAGFPCFLVMHGNRNVIEGDISEVKPGWLVEEIIEQVGLAVRHIRANASSYGLTEQGPNNEIRLGIMGTSSGGSLALQLLTFGGPGDPNQTLYTTDPGVDLESSKPNAAFVFAPGARAHNVLGTDFQTMTTEDTSWFWKWPHVFVHPPYDSMTFDPPMPTPPPAQSFKCECITDAAFDVDMQNGGRPIRVETSNYPYADTNWSTVHLSCGPPIDPTVCDPPQYGGTPVPSSADPPDWGWTMHVYDETTMSSPPYCCVTPMINYLDLFDTVAAVDSNTLPILWAHGDADGQVTYSQATEFSIAVGNASPQPDFTLITLPGERHGWRDLDGIADESAIAWFRKQLLGDIGSQYIDSDNDGVADALETSTDPHIADHDGDGQPEGAEVLMGTSSQNPWDAFRIMDVTLQESGSNYDVVIKFHAPKTGKYRLQSTSSLALSDSHDDRYPDWQFTGDEVTVGTTGTATMPTITFAPPTSAGALFWRVTFDAEDGSSNDVFDTVSTEPVARLTTRIGRDSVGTDSYTNYLGASLLPQAEFRGRAEDTASGYDINFAGGTIPGTVATDHYVIVTRDIEATQLWTSPIPGSRPDDRGIEGHWWPIDGVPTGTMIDLDGSGRLTNWFEAGGIDNEIAIYRYTSIEELLGPTTGASTTLNGVKLGDIIEIYDATGGTVHHTLTYTTMNGNLEWESSLNLGVPAVLADELILPDQAVGFVAKFHSSDTYLTTVGFVPISDSYAYFRQPPTAGQAELHIKSWPFPEASPLWGPDEGLPEFPTSYLVPSGFTVDILTAQSTASINNEDILYHAAPSDNGYDGDQKGKADRMVGYTVAARFDRHDYTRWCNWDAPPCQKDGTAELVPGRGYALDLHADNHGAVMEWLRRRPYRRP